MAMSKPMSSAQLGCIVKCEVCDTVEDVNSFCKNCLQNLCNNCKKLHQKIPSLRSHEIGSIGDGRRILRSKEWLCSDHGEIFNYRCKTCSLNVCAKCLSNHLKHDLLDIEEEGQSMKEKLEKVLECKSELLEKIRGNKERIIQHKKKFDSSEEDVISKMNEEFEMMMKIKTELTGVVKERFSSERKQMDEKIYVFQTFESKLQEEIRRIKEDLPLHSGPSLIKFSEDESDMLSKIKNPPLDTELPNAMGLSSPPLSKIVDNTKQFTVKMRRGIAQIIPERIFSTDLQILSSFCLTSSSIICIELQNKDTAWITIGKEKVEQVDKEGNVHQIIKMSPNPLYLAIQDNGDILVTSGKSEPIQPNIRKFSSQENISILAKLTDFEKLYDLAFDHLGFLFCHARLSMNDLMLKINKESKITWKTDLGSHTFYVSSITFSPQNQCHVALGSNICVIDDEGLVLRRQKWDSKLGGLGPILFDNNGYMLAGTDMGTVHVLNEDFDVLKSYSSDILKGSVIKAFAIDENNHLWVGNSRDLVCITKYNID